MRKREKSPLKTETSLSDGRCANPEFAPGASDSNNYGERQNNGFKTSDGLA
jgi:hypothetical protein